MNLTILGLLTAVPVGLLIAAFALALCKAASRGDRAIIRRRMLGLSPKDAATRQMNREVR
jgi:hypothetical protein